MSAKTAEALRNSQSHILLSDGLPMAQHKVIMTMPTRELKRADAKFAVDRDGKKLGTLTVSNGSLVWFPRYTSYGCKMTWKQFDELMNQHATRVEKR